MLHAPFPKPLSPGGICMVFLPGPTPGSQWVASVPPPTGMGTPLHCTALHRIPGTGES